MSDTVPEAHIGPPARAPHPPVLPQVQGLRLLRFEPLAVSVDTTPVSEEA